jgi:hypothetical protein
MTTAAKKVLEAALELPADERERIVVELAASLQGGFAAKEVEEAWLTEIDRLDGARSSQGRRRSTIGVRYAISCWPSSVTAAERRHHLLDGAREDLRHAAQWYEGRAMGAGTALVLAIDHAISKVLEAPQRWPALGASYQHKLLARP